MKTVEIVVYGDPVPQGRPRFARMGNYVHAYDPQRSKNYKELVRFWITQALKKNTSFKPLKNACILDLTIYMGIPTSWNKTKRIEASEGVIRPIGKRAGDLDNIVKLIQDSANGLLWEDDSVITDLHARKRYTAELARVEIKVTEVE